MWEDAKPKLIDWYIVRGGSYKHIIRSLPLFEVPSAEASESTVYLLTGKWKYSVKVG